MKSLVAVLITLFVSFSANAFYRSCVGVARVLEIIAKEELDTETEQK